VTVVLSVDRREPTLADRVNLKIDVTADENYEVQLPRFGEKLEQFGIVDYQTSQPELVGTNRTRVSRSYVLEPFLSGEYSIPAMKVRFWKKGESEAQGHDVETEELTIKVRSLLPGRAADLKIGDIVPPVRLPRDRAWWTWLAAIVGGALAAAAAGWAVWRRRRQAAVERLRRVPAHELAYGELEKLIADDLPGKGQIKLFYQRISDILRRYIENRFGLHAPEQTTEEFLDSLRSSDRLNEQYRALLQAFLRHCDLVKFAEHQPTLPDIQRTFDSCREFISGTEEKDAPAAA
jgi:hypothetical protein